MPRKVREGKKTYYVYSGSTLQKGILRQDIALTRTQIKNAMAKAKKIQRKG